MAAHQLNYVTHELGNPQLPSEKTVLNFQYWDISSCNILFHGQNWSFQQDSAPAHNAQITQKCQVTNVPDFISTSGCSSVSPELNRFDYKLRSKLQGMAIWYRHHNIESWKRSLRKAATDFPVDALRNSIDGWPQRLKDVFVLIVIVLNKYLRFWFITHLCSSCY